MKMTRMFTGILLGCAIFLFAGHAIAGYSSIVALGDSLTDDGSGNGRHTDGPMWIELAAGNYNATLFNFAYSGATTGAGALDMTLNGVDMTLNGVASQLTSSSFQNTVDTLDLSSTLFTVWAGANDLVSGKSYRTAVDNIIETLTALAGMGAESILVPNLPDIGQTPHFYGSELDATATAASMAFNAYLSSELASFASSFSGRLYTMDIFALLNAVTPETDAWKYMFWVDGYHPSAAGHYMISYAAMTALNAPLSNVPVPATILLLGSGLLGMAGFRRRHA